MPSIHPHLQGAVENGPQQALRQKGREEVHPEDCECRKCRRMRVARARRAKPKYGGFSR